MIIERKNEILNLSFEFALKCIAYCEVLEENKKYMIARQLLKSGTSIGANVREAQNTESCQDFIHKLKIAAKEAEETEYWLLLCNQLKNYPSNNELLISIKKILNAIISKTKKRTINKN
jgi:four helix bundle protein